MTTTYATDTRALAEAALRKGVAARLHGTDDPIEHGGDVVAVELLDLGYLVHPAELRDLSELDLQGILAAARKISGADRTYVPVYPGFPAQVRNLSTLGLIIDQIVYYFSVAFDPDGKELDRYATVDRSVDIRPSLPVADLLIAAKPLRVADADGLLDLAKSLIRRPVALSPDDREFVMAVLAYAVAHHSAPVVDSDLDELLTGVRNRENWQTVIEALNNSASVPDETVASAALRTAEGADDLLRAVLTLYTDPLRAGSDAEHARVLRSLSDSGHWAVGVRSVPKPIRKLLVRRLGELTDGYRADALFTRSNLWRRVMRYAHPYQFARTDAEKRALDIVHSNIEYKTFASLVEAAFEAGQLTAAVDLLSQRPGQLVARIVHLASLDGDLNYLRQAVADAGSRARATQLVAAYNGLAAVAAGRSTVQRVTGRANFVREQTSTLSAADAGSLQQAIRTALVTRMRGLGGDLITPGLMLGTADTAVVSTINRDASSTDRALERGEKFTVRGEHGVLRLFVHWFNGPWRVDLDLGALLLDADFRQVTTVDYSSHHDNRGFATYSGDITDAPMPDGAAEFIDVDLKAVLRAHPDARYVAMTVNSYTGQHLSAVDHLAGAMLCSDGDAGKHFDPRTVTTAFRSSSESTLVSPMVVDLVTCEAIWVDTSNGSRTAGYSISRGGTLAEAIAAEIGVDRMTYGDMAEIAAEAFGLKTDIAAVDRELVKALLAL
ncbi:hypothetical protein [Mycobacteroides abscessus]|uniref:hypothetical protein n=1 Tax=Mycobacteroides abscessus TaxID=36809 RepID=UPI0009D361AA|nr:hypothetical protein [Mycobacteroides abscessus]SKH40941.1 Uncharacterised protein [Mycobacteroides abscessus subsp. massiliense]